MRHPAALPGFVATESGPPDPLPDCRDPGTVTRVGAHEVRHWGLTPTTTPNYTLTVSPVVRDTRGDWTAERVAVAMSTDPAVLTELLPPFASLSANERAVTMVADSMGFRHLFHTTADSGAPPLMSSSSLVAGRRLGARLDDVGVAVQSLLGWQLGQRTLFEGIRKLDPGAVARLHSHRVDVETPPSATAETLTVAQAVTQAAQLLRTSLEALLDQHPDAVIQLTGGMDSRLLLSAVPEGRRRGMRAMTLEVPGSGDVAVARAIAQRYGLEHEVHGLKPVADLTSQEVWARCVADAVRLDAMADPLALSAQRLAESSFHQGVRISGLGGEIARGFYYLGRVKDRPYTRADTDRLASWRMFVNEAVEPGVLTDQFSTWAREVANQEVYDAMRMGGDEWFRAADELYVRHRMQRWAGATDTAVSDQRTVVNPMLDPVFLDIASRLSPKDKAGSRFLAALQLELDPELSRRPLDGRPAPITYVDPPPWRPVLDAARVGRRMARKGIQRFTRSNRPPAGGTVMAEKVVEFWRAEPSTLDPVRGLGFVHDGWVDSVLSGALQPRPSSVAFLTNLVVSTSVEL